MEGPRSAVAVTLWLPLAWSLRCLDDSWRGCCGFGMCNAWYLGGCGRRELAVLAARTCVLAYVLVCLPACLLGGLPACLPDCLPA